MIRCYIVDNKIVKVVNTDYAKRKDEHNATLKGLGNDVEFKDANFDISTNVGLDDKGNVVEVVVEEESE